MNYWIFSFALLSNFSRKAHNCLFFKTSVHKIRQLSIIIDNYINELSIFLLMDTRTRILNTLLGLDKIHLRALARELQLHPSTIKKFIVPLVSENILKLDKNEKLMIYFDETKKAKITKTYLLHMQLYHSNLISHVNGELFEPTIILFGSCAKGEMSKASDIDLCIICDDPKEIDVKKYENILRREIHIFTYTKKMFQELSKEFRNNILNGIIVQGFVEVYE